MKPQGLIFVISAPSGAGKSTLCRAIMAREPRFYFSISVTTRAPRGQEVNGRDYEFVSKDIFQNKIAAGEFLEWAQVHDNFYGTLKAPILAQAAAGRDVLLDIDPQGAVNVKKQFPECTAIFICPPSWEELEKRLRGRAQDDEKTIAKRLANARKELTYIEHYDYVVTNDTIEQGLNDLMAIVKAEHLKRKNAPAPLAGAAAS
jgi:guanylate kinase